MPKPPVGGLTGAVPEAARAGCASRMLAQQAASSTHPERRQSKLSGMVESDVFISISDCLLFSFLASNSASFLHCFSKLKDPPALHCPGQTQPTGQGTCAAVVESASV